MDRDSSLPVPWSQLQAALQPDGSLRDIVVLDTTIGDWERAYRFIGGVAASGEARLAPDPDPLPETVSDIFALWAGDNVPMLGIDLGDVRLNCHFFGELEIEFDVRSNDVDTEARAQVLLTFMRGLAQAVGRPGSPHRGKRPRMALADLRSWDRRVDGTRRFDVRSAGIGRHTEADRRESADHRSLKSLSVRQ